MNIRTFGFELELFALDKAGKPIDLLSSENRYKTGNPPPSDGCGYLAEARGDKHEDPRKAMYLLRAEMDRVTQLAADSDIYLHREDTWDIPKEFLRAAIREHGKKESGSFFARGGGYKNNTPRAGLHIHFGAESKHFRVTKQEEGKWSKPYECSQIEQLNIPRIIWVMDEAFGKEIKAAKRIIGEYELKPYGFEYRSLPASVDLDKVVTVLQKLQRMRG